MLHSNNSEHETTILSNAVSIPNSEGRKTPIWSCTKYTYDGDGRRVIKAGPATTYFFYDPSGRLLSEVTPDPKAGKEYIYISGEPVARVDWTTEQDLGGNVLRVDKNSPNVHLDWSLFPTAANDYVVRRKQVVDPGDKTFDGSAVITSVSDPTQTYDDPVLNDGNDYNYRVYQLSVQDVLYFYHADHLGTPIAMTDGAASLVWRVESFSFGGAYGLPVEDVENNLRFPGQYYDAETGLAYNLFRDYSERTGRYREPDPVGLSRATNLYSYAYQNPLLYTDPSGLRVNLRCRRVGAPGGGDDSATWIARYVAGSKHCFVEVTCPKVGISPTLISYLGPIQIVEDWQNSTQVNNDVLYSRLGQESSPKLVETLHGSRLNSRGLVLRVLADLQFALQRLAQSG